MRFALLEMKMFLVKVLKKFEVLGTNEKINIEFTEGNIKIQII